MAVSVVMPQLGFDRRVLAEVNLAVAVSGGGSQDDVRQSGRTLDVQSPHRCGRPQPQLAVHRERELRHAALGPDLEAPRRPQSEATIVSDTTPEMATPPSQAPGPAPAQSPAPGPAPAPSQ